MVAYRQPVLPDVNVFDKDAAVGEMVGARVSPELVGGGVGACVVTGMHSGCVSAFAAPGEPVLK